MARQLEVQTPRSSFGAGQLGYDGASDDLQAVAHAGQQPVKLLVAQLDLPGEELADAGLMHTADTRQFGLGGARLEHHLMKHVSTTGHAKSIRSEEHTSELQSRFDLVCRLLLEKKKI